MVQSWLVSLSTDVDRSREHIVREMSAPSATADSDEVQIRSSIEVASPADYIYHHCTDLVEIAAPSTATDGDEVQSRWSIEVVSPTDFGGGGEISSHTIVPINILTDDDSKY